MVQHMNDDHQEAMVHYCENPRIPVPTNDKPAMAGVDSEGFELRLGARIVRFDFGGEVSMPLEVRAELVGMAHVD